MTKTIFDLHSPHPEPSTLVAFAENHLDRKSEHRPDDCIEAALKHPGAHFLAFSGAKLIVKHDEKIIDPLFAPYELAGLEPTMDDAVLLGFLPNGEPRLAVPSGLTEETVPEPFKIADARMLYRQQMLPENLLGQFAQASSLIVWNAATGSAAAAAARWTVRPAATGASVRPAGTWSSRVPIRSSSC